MNKNSNSACKRIILSLVRLLNAMNRSQKENLRKNARASKGAEDQKYIQLFHAIELFIKSKKDPADLPAHLLESGQFGKSSDLHATASYLFERVMDQIRSTPNAIAQRHNQLLQLIQDIHFLFFHDLYLECYRAIKQAKKLANDIDRPAYILELQVWEARIITRMKNIPWDLDHMRHEMEEAIANLKNTHSTFLRSQQLFTSLTGTGDHIPPETDQIINNLVSEPSESLDLCTPRLHYWKLVELQYCFDLQYVISQKNKQEREKRAILSSALYYNRQNLDMMSQGKGKVLAEEEPVNYLSALENYLNKCLQIKNEEGIRVLESEFLKKYIQKEEIHQYRLICYFKLNYFMRFNQFKEACAYIENENLEVNLQSRQHLISDSRMSIIRNNCTLAYFLSGNYEKALQWALVVLKNPRRHSNTVAYILCDMVYTICLLETNTFQDIYDHMNKLHKKYKRRFPENKFLHDLLATIRYAAMPPHAQYLEVARENRNKLEAVLLKNESLGVYAPMLAWVNMRISSQPTNLIKEALKYDI